MRAAEGEGVMMNESWTLCEELADVVDICLKAQLKLWLEIKFLKETQSKERRGLVM